MLGMSSQGAKRSQTKRHKAATVSNEVEPFRPRFDMESSCSMLTEEEVEERIAEKDQVALDPLNPEESLWLKDILKELEAQDVETRLFALCRLQSVLHRIINRDRRALNAGFAACLLEQGVLNEVIRILKAAQLEGDFYHLAGGGQNCDGRLRAATTPEGCISVLSKVSKCFKLRHALMADVRTVRFIWKAIPDLLIVLEGVYLAEPAVATFNSEEGPRTMEVEHSVLSDTYEERSAALSALGYLAFWSDKHVKRTICSRKTLLVAILDDCMAETELSREIIDNVFILLANLSSVPGLLSGLLDKFLRAAMKALDVSEEAAVIKEVVNLLAAHIPGETFQLRKRTLMDYSVTLSAVAACPAVEEVYKGRIYRLLTALNPRAFNPFISDFERDLQKLLAASPRGMARKQELSEIFVRDWQRNRQQSLSQFEVHTCVNCEDAATVVDQQRASETVVSKQGPRAEVTIVTTCTEEEIAEKRKPCRKCSHTGCPKKESASNEFKLCSQCRLAIYCSRGKRLFLEARYGARSKSAACPYLQGLTF